MAATPSTSENAVALLGEAKQRIMTEVRKVIIGQDAIVEDVLTAFFAGGNCLLVSVPGLAKTLLISTLGRAIGLTFRRVQFTPDLMPSDITGTEILEEDRATGRGVQSSGRGPSSPTFCWRTRSTARRRRRRLRCWRRCRSTTSRSAE